MSRWLIRISCMIALGGLVFMALPPASASADQCNSGEIYCMPDAKVVLSTQDPCASQSAGNLFGLFSGNTCTSASGLMQPTTAQVSPGVYIPGITDVFVKLTQFAQTDAFAMLNFVLTTQLSGNNVAESPVLVCQQAQGAQRRACAGNSEWFLGQYGLMRMIGLYVMVPLFFIMVIQSIARGNIFLLLKSSLLMLPLAVLGTVALITIMQLLLNIADDFCNYIVARATVGLAMGTCTVGGQTVTSAACGFTQSLAERSFGNTNLFVAFMIYILLFAASVSIYLELVGRELGIYTMAMIMPLAMAAIVWPRAAAVARQLFQWELAAIFAKIFMVAAVSLGLSAFANSSTTTCTSPVANGQAVGVTACGTTGPHAPFTHAGAAPGAPVQDVASNDGITTSLQGLLIVCLASFAFMKSVVTLTPAAVTGQKPIWDKGSLRSRGQAMSVLQQRIVQFQKFVNKKRKPGTDYKSKGHNPTDKPPDTDPLNPQKPNPNTAPSPPTTTPPNGNNPNANGGGGAVGAGGGGAAGGGGGGGAQVKNKPIVIDEDGNQLGGSRGPGVPEGPEHKSPQAIEAPMIIDMDAAEESTEHAKESQAHQARSEHDKTENTKAHEAREQSKENSKGKKEKAPPSASEQKWLNRAAKWQKASDTISGKSRDSLIGKFANDWAMANDKMAARKSKPDPLANMVYTGGDSATMQRQAEREEQLKRPAGRYAA